MQKGLAQPATKPTERPAPIADADRDRRAMLHAFQSGDTIAAGAR